MKKVDFTMNHRLEKQLALYSGSALKDFASWKAGNRIAIPASSWNQHSHAYAGVRPLWNWRYLFQGRRIFSYKYNGHLLKQLGILPLSGHFRGGIE